MARDASRSPPTESALALHRHRLVVTLLAGGLVLAAFAAYATGEHAEVQNRVADETEHGATTAQFEWRVFLRGETSTVLQFERLALASGGLSTDAFRALADAIQEDVRGSRELALVSRDGEVLANGGGDPSVRAGEAVPVAWGPVLAAAEESPEPALSTLIPTNGQPEYVIAQAIPNPETGEVDRFVVAQIPLNSAIERAFSPGTVDNFALTFHDGDVSIPVSDTDAAADAPTMQVPLHATQLVRALGTPPQLDVQVSEARMEEMQASRPTTIATFGLFAGLLVAGGTWRELGRQGERAEAQRRLAASEVHYRDLFEQAGELILVLDADARVRRANRFAERSLGYADGTLKGRAFRDLADPSQRDAIQQRFHDLRQSGEDQAFEGTLRARDGERVDVYGTITVVLDEHGEPEAFRAYFADVTKLRVLEERLRHANRSLSDKVHELDSFAYTVAHDLKSPLRGVASYAEFLEEDYGGELPAEAREYVTQIRAGTDRLRSMVEALLRYSRAGGEQYPVEQVETTQLVDDAIADLHTLLQDHDARVEVATELPDLEAQRIPLKQVFTNLISNAVKYNDKDEPLVTLESRPSDGGWEFVVADNGPGILEAEKDRLFELFHRGTNGGSASGTGVGLAIVKRIVEGHGGRVWAENRAGGGAAFHFTLPERAAP